MTEEIVLETIQKVSEKLASNYKFGFHEASDIQQEMFIEALQALEGYDPARPLENYLSVYLSNRFKNRRRNEYYRSDYICKVCHNSGEYCDRCKKYQLRNSAKKNLMEPFSIDEALFGASLDYNTDDAEIKEILEIIDKNLETHYREDYLKMRAGVKVTAFKRRTILNRIKEILQDAKA